MSMHYFYNYKDELEHKLKKVYSQELGEMSVYKKQQKQLDVAQNLIEAYYDKLSHDLADIVEVSQGHINFIKTEVLMKFIMFDHYVMYSRFDRGIEVEIGTYDKGADLIEARIDSNIIPGDKKCVVKKIGQVHDGAHFDENTINHYMNKAFSHLEILKE